MIGLIESPLVATRRKRVNLCLHCGAEKASREDVATTMTPLATPTWQPIPHIDLIERVEFALQTNHLQIVDQAHSLSHGGDRYFGLIHVRDRTTQPDDYAWVLGVRNSHDKRFPAGLVAGVTVFTCDNLSFHGEIKVIRKHTRFILRDLPSLVQGAVGRLMGSWHQQAERIEAYKHYRLTDERVHDLLVRSVDVGVVPNRDLPEVLAEWRNPRHEEFAPRNAWSLFNGYTEVLKGNLAELPRRTERLHGLLDLEVGVSLTN
jgi:hypothetical protein